MEKREPPQNIDYGKMSPVELNKEFERIYSFAFGADDSPAAAAARTKGPSELKDILKSKLEKLLTHSQLTSSCQKFVIEYFEVAFILGGQDPLVPDLYKWGENGGIFDKVQAPGVERGLYRGEVFLQSGRETFMKKQREGNIKSREDILVLLAEEVDYARESLSPDEFEKFLPRHVAFMEEEFNSSEKRQKEDDAFSNREAEQLRTWRQEYIEKYSDEP